MCVGGGEGRVVWCVCGRWEGRVVVCSSTVYPRWLMGDHL